MSRKPPITEESTPPGSLSRRGFMGAIAVASAGAAAAVGGLVLPTSAQAEVQFPKERGGFGAGGSAAGADSDRIRVGSMGSEIGWAKGDPGPKWRSNDGDPHAVT